MAADRCRAMISKAVNINADQFAAAAFLLSKILRPSIPSNGSHVKNPNTAEQGDAEAEGLNEEQYCVICLAQVCTGEKYKHLAGCNHGFHEDCIEAWLQSSHSCNCPICRCPVQWEEQQRLLLHAMLISGFFRTVEHVCTWFLDPLAFD